MPSEAMKKDSQVSRVRGKRSKVNLVGICLNIFGPWLIFLVVFSAVSFSYHYKHPSITWAFCIIPFVLSAFLFLMGVRSSKKGNPPTWFFFGAFAVLLAHGAGFIVGWNNFWDNMQPFYELNNLRHVKDLDPALTGGSEVLDSGVVEFKANSKLDLPKALGFKDEDVYCVVPITRDLPANQKAKRKYEFWAVGKNCCSGTAGDFHCGDYANPSVNNGLRNLNDEDRRFYRLAVMQAEAKFGIESHTPVFFFWLKDARAEGDSWGQAGFKTFIMAMFIHFAVNLFLVVLTILCFTTARFADYDDGPKRLN
jgi:hypothetical protein